MTFNDYRNQKSRITYCIYTRISHICLLNKKKVTLTQSVTFQISQILTNKHCLYHYIFEKVKGAICNVG